MLDTTSLTQPRPTDLSRPAPNAAPWLRRLLMAVMVASTLCLSTPTVFAQYNRVRSVDVSEKHAALLKRSRWARRFLVVRGVTVSARPGLSLLKDTRSGAVHVVPPAMSQPPRTYFESIIVPGDGPNDQTVAYVCGCAEQNADPNNDDCGFEVDNNYNSMCRWEGDGESRCTCEPRVVIWGNGQEDILTYAGDPVG